MLKTSGFDRIFMLSHHVRKWSWKWTHDIKTKLAIRRFMIESVGITGLDDGGPIQNSITATLMCYLWQCKGCASAVNLIAWIRRRQTVVSPKSSILGGALNKRTWQALCRFEERWKWKKLVYLKSLCVEATVKVGCDIRPPMESVTARQASKMFGLVQGWGLFFNGQCHQHILAGQV